MDLAAMQPFWWQRKLHRRWPKFAPWANWPTRILTRALEAGVLQTTGTGPFSHADGHALRVVPASGIDFRCFMLARIYLTRNNSTRSGFGEHLRAHGYVFLRHDGVRLLLVKTKYLVRELLRLDGAVFNVALICNGRAEVFARRHQGR